MYLPLTHHRTKDSQRYYLMILKNSMTSLFVKYTKGNMYLHVGCQILVQLKMQYPGLEKSLNYTCSWTKQFSNFTYSMYTLQLKMLFSIGIHLWQCNNNNIVIFLFSFNENQVEQARREALSAFGNCPFNSLVVKRDCFKSKLKVTAAKSASTRKESIRRPTR